MKNNKTKISILIIILLVIIYFIIFGTQNYTLEKSLVKNYNEGVSVSGDEKEYVRCNINIFKPEFAYVSMWSEKGHVSFDKPTRLFSQNQKEGENSYIGGTTITHTNFPELLKMVKQDCYQFQQDYNNPNVDQGGIDGGYREYDREAEKAEELKRQQTNEALGIKRYEGTEENLKKLEAVLSAEESISTGEKQEIMEDMKKDVERYGYFEIGADLD